MAEAADFLVESLIFDWMMSKLGGVKGWAQVYEMEKEIAAGRAKPPKKGAGKNGAKTGQRGNAPTAQTTYNQILEYDERQAKAAKHKTAAKSNRNCSKNKRSKEAPQNTGCSCSIL